MGSDVEQTPEYPEPAHAQSKKATPVSINSIISMIYERSAERRADLSRNGVAKRPSFGSAYGSHEQIATPAADFVRRARAVAGRARGHACPRSGPCERCAAGARGR